MNASQKRQLLLVSVGGTISLEKEPQTGRSVPSRSAAALAAALSLTGGYEVQCVDAPPSLRVMRHPADLLAFVHFLEQQLCDAVSGIVISQGTDTLEEVAYCLDEIFAPRVPVVITGAMRPSWAAGYDGVRNLENALRLASVAPAEYGVLVTLNDEIFEAWSVYKTDTAAFDAFAARRGAASGRILGDHVELSWRPTPRARFGVVPRSLPLAVPILTMGVGDDAAVLNVVAADAVQGLIVAGMGAGSVPPVAQERVVALARQGVPIVLCSSALSGPTALEHYYPGDYDELRAGGVVIEDRLNARKARIRLLLSLGLGIPYSPFGA